MADGNGNGRSWRIPEAIVAVILSALIGTTAWALADAVERRAQIAAMRVEIANVKAVADASAITVTALGNATANVTTLLGEHTRTLGEIKASIDNLRGQIKDSVAPIYTMLRSDEERLSAVSAAQAEMRARQDRESVPGPYDRGRK